MAVCTAFSTPIPPKPRKSVGILYKRILGPLLTKKIVHTAEFLCYDDGCHVRKFANNPVRSTLTDTTKRIAAMEIVIDKMHFKGHINPWWRRYCNPNDLTFIVGQQVTQRLDLLLQLSGGATCTHDISHTTHLLTPSMNCLPACLSCGDTPPRDLLKSQRLQGKKLHLRVITKKQRKQVLYLSSCHKLHNVLFRWLS